MTRSRAILPFAAIAFAATTAHADPLPPGSIGLFTGVVAGTGPDANALGLGPVLGAHAAWQPTTTTQRVGYSVKLSAMFGYMYTGDAARITDPLRILQLDLMPIGIRVRPGTHTARFLTLRVGGTLLRTDQQIPPDMDRAYAGAIASIGLEQHAFGLVFNLDVRYSMLGMRPGMLGLVLGFGKTGP